MMKPLRKRMYAHFTRASFLFSHSLAQILQVPASSSRGMHMFILQMCNFLYIHMYAASNHTHTMHVCRLIIHKRIITHRRLLKISQYCNMSQCCKNKRTRQHKYAHVISY